MCVPFEANLCEGPLRLAVDDGNDNSGLTLPLVWPEGELYVRGRDGECRSRMVVDPTPLLPR